MELALLGASKSGVSLDSETYQDALLQGAQDIACSLDDLTGAVEAIERAA